MELTPWRDERRFHLVTRGNVDGIIAAALFYAKVPQIKVSFVTSTSGATDALRRDIQSREFYIVDLALNEELQHAVALRAKQGAQVHVLDHHQQSTTLPARWAPLVDVIAQQGPSAAALAHRFLGLDGAHEHLAAIADVMEYCRSPALERSAQRWGIDRVAQEARMLDFAWRLEVDNDRFRTTAARRLAEGRWPSEVSEIRSRYLQVVNEGRWEKALDKIRARIVVRDGVGVLRFGRARTSLHGFGTRALAHVAEEAGCRVAVLVNSRKRLSSLSLRGLGLDYAFGGRPPLNLGRFVEDFTRDRGITGGGHPSSAGAKIYTRDVPMFLQQVHAMA